ncbi:Aste57867_17377 [Aphanomyces stellatus]|uniref:Serine/threonine-protein phosphatase n=1 Tax=Aphanomyces stellatus TaxID=120398 RepID=A0A485L8W8_9STRA|nr:hypothetical protein As57867_017317 [Aphanomyces stellatus]VFT94133.1 Aste57867_17377 [Aphanomyces stellatus]
MGNAQGKTPSTKQTRGIPAAPQQGSKPEDVSAAPAPVSPAFLDEEMRTQWKLFNDLENREEAEAFGLQRFLQALHDHMPALAGQQLGPNLDDLLNDQLAKIDITDMYKGVHLDETLTLKNVTDLIDSYKRKTKLHKAYVMQILRHAATQFQAYPNIHRVTIAPAKHITVIGDLHGQLDDLLLIFRENGLPSPDNPYVFNGDFVDRGKSSVEVCLLLFCFALLYPDAVFLNRGNHEDKSVTTKFGFHKECVEKYDDEVFVMFCHCFRYLPLGTLLQDRRIFILHGGVPRQPVKLEEMMDIPRFEFDGLRHTNKYMKAAGTKLTRFERNMQLISDIVWSDPRGENGWKESHRGAGIEFGPDIAKRFLVQNNLALLVRSHECTPLGYTYPFSEKAGLMVTLFSASNYTKASNMGAIMRIPSDKKLAPSFMQYRAKATEHDFVGANLDGLFSVILSSRDALLAAFEAADAAKTGAVTSAQWREIMEATLRMPLDWASLQPLVTSVEKNDTVAYVAFLDRYQSHAATASGGDDKKVINRLYRHRERLEALFHTLDRDGNGVITLEEMQEALEVLNKHLPRDMLPFEHPDQLMAALDFSKDNAININEFLESFRLHANLTVQAKWRRAKNKLKAMHHLGMLKIVESSSVPVVPLDEVAAVVEHATEAA